MGDLGIYGFRILEIQGYEDLSICISSYLLRKEIKNLQILGFLGFWILGFLDSGVQGSMGLVFTDLRIYGFRSSLF